MRVLRDILARLNKAIAPPPAASRYMCAGCDQRDHCGLPPARRRLCWETRAMLMRRSVH